MITWMIFFFGDFVGVVDWCLLWVVIFEIELFWMEGLNIFGQKGMQFCIFLKSKNQYIIQTKKT
jgi:hypothetical protein